MPDMLELEARLGAHLEELSTDAEGESADQLFMCRVTLPGGRVVCSSAGWTEVAAAAQLLTRCSIRSSCRE